MLNKLLKSPYQSESIRKLSLWSISIVLIFLGFFGNSWRVADQNWFANHQKDTESHIMGRMVKSRQDGILSAGGLNGWGTAIKNDAEWIPSIERGPQYNAYLYELSFENYSTYKSQPGGQGMVFSLLDRLIPLSPTFKFWMFYVLTSLLSAVALTYIIYWFYNEFGGLVSIFVLSSVVLSQWLTVFGRNLWWCIWAFYLPMIVVMKYLQSNRDIKNRQFVKFGVLIFIAVSVKCFINGYEYITTTLLMMMTPFIFYATIDRWNKRRFIKGTLAAVIGSGLAIFLSMIMLCFQIGAVKGGFMDGVEHVIWSFGKRTYGNAEDFPPVYAASLEAGAYGVVITYINGIFFDLNNYISISNTFISNYLFKIRYYYLIVLFAFASILLYCRNQKLDVSNPKVIALIIATWFSISAPLSWFIIFKAHSYIHTHMSFLLWQMPFTLFGFAVIGIVFNTKTEYITER